MEIVTGEIAQCYSQGCFKSSDDCPFEVWFVCMFFFTLNECVNRYVHTVEFGI